MNLQKEKTMITLTRQFNKFGKAALISLAGVAIFGYFWSGAIAQQTITSAEQDVGSLALSDLNEILLNQSPQLSQEVRQALQQAGQDDVGCFAPLIRLSVISDLNNTRVAPFSCSFADDKSLTIQARTIAILPDGETMPLEQLLRRDNIPEGVNLQFELTSWQWTNANEQSAVEGTTVR